MYDSTQLLKLLEGKYVVMFGDSTLEENMYDLILLLTSRDLDAMATYLTTGVRCEPALQCRMPCMMPNPSFFIFHLLLTFWLQSQGS